MSDVVGPAQFEFTEAHNQVFRELGKRMSTVGTLTMVFGALTVLASVVTAAKGGGSSVVSGVLWLVFGSWTQNAGKAFTAIATTQGNDVDHLMLALEHLRKLYKAMYGLLITGVILAAVVFVIAIVLVGSYKL
ncbi:MAG: hypothetical protein JWM80_3794 [Cyanobacteria bacterium RYN_339]|nr:hypothetical protein [Cyanobacteria bacterium RYN_339]